jgi:hypothetical protein
MTYREQFEQAMKEWSSRRKLRLLCLLQFGLTVEARALVKGLPKEHVGPVLAVLNEIQHKVSGQVMAYVDGTARYDAHELTALLYGMASGHCEEGWERAVIWALRKARERS